MKAADGKIVLESTEEILYESLSEREKLIFISGKKKGQESMTPLIIVLWFVMTIIFLFAIGVHNYYKHGSIWTNL